MGQGSSAPAVSVRPELLLSELIGKENMVCSVFRLLYYKALFYIIGSYRCILCSLNYVYIISMKMYYLFLLNF